MSWSALMQIDEQDATAFEKHLFEKMGLIQKPATKEGEHSVWPMVGKRDAILYRPNRSVGQIFLNDSAEELYMVWKMT